MATQSGLTKLTKSGNSPDSLSQAWTALSQRRAAMAELPGARQCRIERIVRDAGLTFSDLVGLAKTVQ